MQFSKQLTTIFFMASVAVFASCASQKTVSVRKAKADEGLDKFNSNYDYEKDASGLMRATSDDKSAYSQKQSFSGTRNISGKDYNKKSYSKKDWGKKSNYRKSEFGGRKESDIGGSPYYVQRSRSNDQESDFNGSQYGTSDFSVKNTNTVTSARRANNMAGKSSGYAASRKNLPEPVIMNKKDYSRVTQGKMSVNQTNTMLGR